MNHAINFILESGISLSVLALIYILFLRRETFFKLNRFFLLGAITFSLVLPFLKFQIFGANPVLLEEITVTPYKNLIEAVTVYGKDLSGTIEEAILSANFLILVYLLGVTFFLYRFLFRVGDLTYMILKNPVQKCEGFKLVVLDKETSPFSFLSYVFVSRAQEKDISYHKMLAHELEHIKQGHTFDIIVLEILSAFQWFNPFMWMLRRSIRENHEYLADQAVLKSGVKRGFYKKLLLNQFVGYNFEIANNFNYSLIKKRIKMMSRIRSSKFANGKMIFGVLAAVGLVVVFACEEKESYEMTPVKQNESMTVTILDQKLKIEGAVDGIEKIKNLLSESSNIEFRYDSVGNNIVLSPQKGQLENSSLDSDEQVFFIVEDMPEFPGGENSLRKYIANAIIYPEVAVEKGIQGKVFVSFIVTKNGTIANAKIDHGVDPALDKEALRVVNSLPKWEPGKQKGQAVNVNYTVPINFSMDEDS
ncbi:TonB family protein [Maribellus comscasis]|uniref:TonB family protein n=1 Tax=Maribellus comscasis TaxID=2681766 RepID=A0A6I6KAA0_9BACT|nr:M56 family metallopeptidase [Maribellus comscasis]QGY47094.1 TonB family protein [Maribellus comscasis]